MANMFSDEFVDLEGLEVDELNVLKSSVDTILKLSTNIKGILGGRKKKTQKDKTRAEEELKECIEEWIARPFTRQKQTENIMSAHGRPALEDQDARRAIRRLYYHLSSRRNPIMTSRKAEWDEQLRILVDDLCNALADSAIGDTSHSSLWIPDERPLPLKGMIAASNDSSKTLR